MLWPLENIFYHCDNAFLMYACLQQLISIFLLLLHAMTVMIFFLQHRIIVISQLESDQYVLLNIPIDRQIRVIWEITQRMSAIENCGAWKEESSNNGYDFVVAFMSY